MNKTQKLAMLRGGDTSMSEVMRGVSLIKGEPGYSPIRGVDYFTAEDINMILSYLESKLVHGVDGETPIKGIHYRDGVDGKTPVKGIDYRDGETPILGVDYYTPKEKEALIAEVAKKAKGADGVSPKIGAIVKEVIASMKSTPIHYSSLEGGPDPKELKDLVAFLKRGGYRGGAGTPSTGGSTTFYTQTPVGAIDGVNKVYTVSNTITSVINFSINGAYIHPADYSVVGTTITFITALNVSLAGTPFTITYV